MILKLGSADPMTLHGFWLPWVKQNGNQITINQISALESCGRAQLKCCHFLSRVAAVFKWPFYANHIRCKPLATLRTDLWDSWEIFTGPVVTIRFRMPFRVTQVTFQRIFVFIAKKQGVAHRKLHLKGRLLPCQEEKVAPNGYVVVFWLYSRLRVATAENFWFAFCIVWHLFYGRMPFLPPTLFLKGKLGHLLSWKR